MTDQKNTILAIVLSALVLIAWQYFVGLPQMEKQRQEAQRKAQQQTEQVQKPQQPQQPGRPAPTAQPGQPGQPGQPSAPPVAGQAAAPATQTLSRAAVIAATPRVQIETPTIRGSIALRGGRIDDLALTRYHETIAKDAPPIVLFEPSGAPQPFYAEFGWVGAAGSAVKLPGVDTLWRQQGGGTLAPGRPVTLTYDNGEGLEFRRTVAVDDNYLFTVEDRVANRSAAPVALYPYALISRHGTPPTLGYYILHEGLIAVMGEQGLQELTYKTVEEKKNVTFKVTNAWLGITDKYWAATLLPDPKAALQARFSAGLLGTQKTYQADFLGEAQTIAPGATAQTTSRLFAGAKEVAIVDRYEKELKLNRFELLIDWGWFYFITKPMFVAIDWIYQHVGNFGVAILLITVLIKLVFFPLANKSYASMAKMKAVQPEMAAIRERKTL